MLIFRGRKCTHSTGTQRKNIASATIIDEVAEKSPQQQLKVTQQ
jgi:hypothetical protein